MDKMNKKIGFTLAEVIMAKQASYKACSQEYIRVSKPKAPSRLINKLYAFTLAEVLITLAIIGVVAALTIPTVVKNYQKQQTVVKLKKAYSKLFQAYTMASAEYGMPNTWDISQYPTDDGVRTRHFLNTYIFPYYQKIIRRCEPTSDECWAKVTKRGDGATDAQLSSYHTKHTSYILDDGTCLYAWGGGDAMHAQILIDLNCQKGPNKRGKDIFNFFATFSNTNNKVGFYTMGIQPVIPYTREELKEGCATIGYFCAALIQYDGWEIKDDYPL